MTGLIQLLKAHQTRSPKHWLKTILVLTCGLCISLSQTFAQDAILVSSVNDYALQDQYKTLKSLFKSWENQHQIHILFEDDVISGKQINTKGLSNIQSIEAKLHQVLKPLNLKFKKLVTIIISSSLLKKANLIKFSL